MKNRILFILVFAIFGSVATAHAQLSPMAPLSPTTFQDCQDFSRQVDQFWAGVSSQHDACLAANKPDRPNEQTGSRQCSRSACQSLHDQLYGTLRLLGKTQQQDQRADVTACYNTVNEMLKREAQVRQEEQNRKAARAREDQRELQKKQVESSNAQKSKANEAHQRPATPALRSNTTLDDRTSAYQHPPQPSSNQSAGSAEPSSQRDLQRQKSQEALQEIQAQDPFTRAKQEKATLGLDANNSELPDPFSGASRRASRSAAKGKNDTGQDNAHEEAGNIGVETVKKSGEVASELIEETDKLARNLLSPKALKPFLADSTDLKSVVKTFTGVVTGMELVATSKDVYEAYSGDTAERQKYEVEHLAYEATKDGAAYVFSTDTVKQGVKSVVVRLFPKSKVFFTPNAVSLAKATSGGLSVFFYSSEIGLDDREIVEDRSGRFSLDQRRAALFNIWKDHDQNPTSFGDIKTLIEDTDILYKDARRAGPGD